ncbi:MAG: recombinase family protein [Gammaproteobacteria bacterium]
MRAAIYARYSSDNQRAASIEDQVRLCKEHMTAQGWTLTQTYTDAATSGASLIRPGIQALIEDAMLNRFDVIVTEALDRVSRDQADIAGLYKRLSFSGVRLQTLAEGHISELHVGLKGTMNALFLKDLADKTRRGLRGRVEAGRSGGGNSYGYDVVDERDSHGEPIRGKRTINKEQAEVVRRIYQDYANGLSPRAIAQSLNTEDIPGPRSAGWTASTINGNAARGNGILNNELYIGKIVWNRLRYIKDPDSGKRVSRLNPESEWIIKDAPEYRIIDQDLWDRVKARQGSAKRNTRPDVQGEKPFWDRRRPRYLFSGLTKCGQCGGGYTKISANLFGCATARNKGTCNNRHNIRRDVLEASVLNGLKQHLMDPALFKIFAEEFIQEVNRLRIDGSVERRKQEQDLEKVSAKIKRLVSAIADGIDAKSVKDELLELEAKQEDLKQLLSEPKSAEPLLHPNLAEVYRAKVADLHTSMNADDTKNKAFELIRSLVDKIVLTPKDGELSIDLHGELAGILSLCSEKQKTASQVTSGLEQVKMVAGVGFEPTTFRL